MDEALAYCVYTNKNIAIAEMNSDHIVPLSLGGLNGFEIQACRAFNSQSGAKIEGDIVNDPLFMLARGKSSARGHSKKKPVPIWKKSKLDGEPVQVNLGDTFKVWDSKKQAYKPEIDFVGKQIETKLNLNRHSAYVLACKIALGTAQKLGGLQLIESISSEALRWIINVDLDKIRKNGPDSIPGYAQNIIIADRFHADLQTDHGQAIRHIVEHRKRTTIAIEIFDDKIGFHIGILGMFLSSIFIDADGEKVRNILEHDRGLVILLGPGSYEVIDYIDFLSGIIR